MAAKKKDVQPVLWRWNRVKALFAEVQSPEEEVLFTSIASHFAKVPQFFEGATVALDLSRVPGAVFDFNVLKRIFLERDVVLVGVAGADENQAQAARLAQVAVLDSKVPAPVPPEIKEKKSPALVVSAPVRGGQRIYAEGGDLVVRSVVNPGAEVAADGHIHVWAPLRGRAFAGVSGDERARVFALSLEAEFVSVAGRFKLFDGMPFPRGPVEVSLQEGEVRILMLDGGGRR